MNQERSVLIIEDEEIVRRGLQDLFAHYGFKVESAGDGKEGLEKALARRYSMIILDIMLPTMDGFAVCNEIRKVTREQPIVMLTAKDDEEAIIAGLTLGADDYILKPFSIRELMLRVEAIMRRSHSAESIMRELIVGGVLTVDTKNLVGRWLNRPGEAPLEFTRKEVEILRYLDAHPDRPVSREELLSNVWDYERASEIETRTVDIHIAKIRKKIERNPKTPELLITFRGEGYRLVANPNE